MSGKNLAFGKAIPVLASLNIPRTLQFFAEVLGFETRHLTDFSYGMAARGQVEIHFWLCDEKHIAKTHHATCASMMSTHSMVN
jgi:hypothetical protein